MKRALIFALFACACGTETGNGLVMRATESGSGLRAAQSDLGLSATDAQGTQLSLTLAQINVGKIEFDAPGTKPCAEADFSNSGLSVRCDGAKIRIEGPILVDLMTGTSQPSLENLVIPAGIYKRIDVRFEQLKGGDVTLTASGEIAYRQMPTPYDLALKFNEDARFESPGGITITEDAGEQVLLELDVRRWFSALPLTDCLDDGDLMIEGGRIAIRDKGSKCGMVEAALKDAIKASGRLGKGAKK